MGWWVDVFGILSYVLYVLYDYICVLLAFCKELGIVTLFNWNETFYFWEVLASTMMRDVEKVYIKEVDIPTSFAESRDWFELFFDDVFAPPKLFNIVIQWLAPRQHGD